MMRKSQCCDQSGLKKGPWTGEEDQKLIDYIQKHGHGKWRTLPKNAGLKRCGKSCRLRWTNYLRPDIKRGKFSIEEEDTIIQLHSVLGNKWSAIAAHLPGRTDNEIKNYWNTRIKKRLLRMGIDPITHKPRFDILQLYSLLNSTLHRHNSPQLNVPILPNIGATMLSPSLLNMADSLLSNPPNFQRDRTKDVGSKDFEENLGTTQIGDQIRCLQPNQQFESHVASYSDANGQYLNQGQFLQTHLEQLCNNTTPSSHGYQTSSWQTNEQPLRVGEDFMENCVYNDDIQNIMNGPFENLPKLSYSSLLSTPSSSTTPLNSSSANYVNGSTEDERDSYCSNIMMFDMPNCLQGVNGYI